MSVQFKEIAARMKSFREKSDFTAEGVAHRVGCPIEVYNDYESGTQDIPVGMLYDVAGVLEVDPTLFFTGLAPTVTDCVVVKEGEGSFVERYPGYSFFSLAPNFVDRDMEPVLVMMEPKEQRPEFVTHGGQEFNYVIEGTLRFFFGDKEYLLTPGDSVFFDPHTPHCQQAVGTTTKFIAVING